MGANAADEENRLSALAGSRQQQKASAVESTDRIVAALEALGAKIDENTAAAHQNTYQPWMARMMAEFYNCQDLDGDGLVFGYDFYIAPLDFYPLMMQAAVPQIQAEITAGNIVAVEAGDYRATLKNPRDRSTITKIFDLDAET